MYREHREKQLTLDTPGKSLYNAAEKGDFAEISRLLQENEDPNKYKNEFGWNSLHVACSRNHFKIVRELIHHNADVHHRSNSRWTTLHEAVVKGNIGVVFCLLCENTDINAVQSSGHTPLIQAIYRGHVTLVELLLLFGADPTRNEKVVMRAMGHIPNEDDRNQIRDLVDLYYTVHLGYKSREIKIDGAFVQDQQAIQLRTVAVTIRFSEPVEGATLTDTKQHSYLPILVCRRFYPEWSTIDTTECDVISDVYEIRVLVLNSNGYPKNIDISWQIELSVPLYQELQDYEEIGFKCNSDDCENTCITGEIKADEKDPLCCFSMTVATSSPVTVVIFKRPKVNHVTLYKTSQIVKLSKGIVLRSPEDAFDSPTDIAITVFNVDGIHGADSIFVTDICSLDCPASCAAPRFPLKISFPVSKDTNWKFEEVLGIAVRKDKAKQHWEILKDGPEVNLVDGSITLTVPYFTEICIVRKTDANRNPTEITRSLSYVEQGLRTVAFIIASREVSELAFLFIVECALQSHYAERKNYWVSEGFRIQNQIDEETHAACPGDVFDIRFTGNVEVLSAVGCSKLLFYSSRYNYQHFVLTVKQSDPPEVNGEIAIFIQDPSSVNRPGYNARERKLVGIPVKLQEEKFTVGTVHPLVGTRSLCVLSENIDATEGKRLGLALGLQREEISAIYDYYRKATVATFMLLRKWRNFAEHRNLVHSLITALYEIKRKEAADRMSVARKENRELTRDDLIQYWA